VVPSEIALHLDAAREDRTDKILRLDEAIARHARSKNKNLKKAVSCSAWNHRDQHLPALVVSLDELHCDL
jgi:hypothetical protein